LGELDGVAGAMAWLAIVDRVPSPATPVRTNGYIQSVYVIPPLRNAGHGSVLLQAVVDEAKQLGLDYLAVHPSQFAFPFYKRLGFAPTARVLEMDFRVRVDPEVGR
jgi:GNAT superfamily N-acetyltransferase